jgi:hypothetical protein
MRLQYNRGHAQGAAVLKRLVAACGAAVVVMVSAGTVGAQGVQLSFDQGLVSITAAGVSVRQVLDEWARLGQAEVVNAELLGDRRVSLRLDHVPQAEALAQVMASAGYVARRRTGPAGASDFDLILVLSRKGVRASADAAVTQADQAEPGNRSSEVATETATANAIESERDGDAEVSENAANGREESARPSPGASNVLPSPPTAAAQLPAGRPDGAKPGTATTRSGGTSAPAARPANRSGRPSTLPAPAENNGRPPRTP